MKSLNQILQNENAKTTSPTNTPISLSGKQSVAKQAPDRLSLERQDANGRSPNRSPMSNESGRRKPAKSVADVCPICGGAGFIMPDLTLGHADFGKAVPCRCRQQQQLEKRMRTLQSIGELEVLQRLTFDSFVPQPSHLSPQEVRNLRMVYEKSRAYAQEPHGWLLLTGTFGCGKTHLAAAIANARLNSGQSALFLLVPDLLDHLRAAYNPNNETSYDDLFEQVRNTPRLILYDLGTQSSTPWAPEKLIQLLNHR